MVAHHLNIFNSANAHITPSSVYTAPPSPTLIYIYYIRSNVEKTVTLDIGTYIPFTGIYVHSPVIFTDNFHSRA